MPAGVGAKARNNNELNLDVKYVILIEMSTKETERENLRRIFCFVFEDGHILAGRQYVIVDHLHTNQGQS